MSLSQNPFNKNNWNDDDIGSEYRIADLEQREARIMRDALPEGIEYDSLEYWEHLRAMTATERLQTCISMTGTMWEDVHGEIKAEFPEWSEEDRKIEFVARMYGPTLAGHFRGYLEKRKENGNFN